VFVVDAQGHARMRSVTTGQRTDGVVEVLAGVSAGESVIVAPPGTLSDGAAIRTVGGKS